MGERLEKMKERRNAGRRKKGGDEKDVVII